MKTKTLYIKKMKTEQLITKMRENVQAMQELKDLGENETDEFYSLWSELDEMTTEFYSRRDYKKHL